MHRRLFGRLSYANVIATLALFFALAGGSAYAINEWDSSNIQNETLLSEDIKNATLKAEDYGPGSVSGWRILDENVTTLDLANNAVFSEDIRNNTLTGDDVDEASLGEVPSAADSDELDGIDSTGFVRGNGTTTSFALGTEEQTGRNTNAGDLTVGCQTASYHVQYLNFTTTTADVWVEKSAAGTTAFSAVTDDAITPIGVGTGDEHVTLRAQRGQSWATWEIWATTTGGCDLSVTETEGTLTPVS